MNIIKLLPDKIANQIAAGEVIQRPASAVKEMLENSVDSGATTIQLYVKNAGKTLLQVVDNGSGMSKEDAKMCFKRHATSKIKTTKDLFSIKTMGFRGEALASIAAISHVEINTKLKSKEIGVHINIEAGKIKKTEESNCPEGTSIKIKNLFYNVPARRKFLKSDNVEMRHIVEEFTRISLANSSIKMQIFHNDNELMHLPESNFRKRIVNIMGNKQNELLVPMEEKTSLVNITGFIGKPESAKRTRGEQYIFVNQRFIKSNYLNHAIKKAFEDLIPDNYFPSYFINLKVDKSLIDINIHPNKTEVKFENEKEIYSIIRATAKRSLGSYNIAPSIDFAQEISFNLDYKTEKSNNIKKPEIKIDKSYNPFKKNIISSTPNNQTHISSTIEVNKIETKNSEPIYIGQKYIGFSSEEGLLLIHQKRAHQRILFEYYHNALINSSSISQQLLFPITLTFNKKDLNLIVDLKKLLKEIGFKFNQIDASNISITAMPSECTKENIQVIIEGLIEEYKTNESFKIDQYKKTAIILANQLTISNNKRLTKEEMIILKKELMKCANPNSSATGKRTMINLKKKDLEKYF